MLYISHRGNLNGPNPEKENHPTYIYAAVSAGFDVEIDVWYENGKFVLGHDAPQYEVADGSSWFYNYKFWLHCKSIEAFYKCLNNPLVNAFFHNEDDCTLTTRGFIWTYPRNLLLTNKSIAVMPERLPDWDISKAYAICTDHPIEFKKKLENK